MQENIDESILDKFSDYMMQHGEYEPPSIKNVREEYYAAQELKRLELFHSSKLPDDSFEMWNKITDQGTRLKNKIKKFGESPKITFSRFIKKKRDEYETKRKAFAEKYGYDYNEVDFNNSSSQNIVKKSS
jgi:hypothetical protein